MKRILCTLLVLPGSFSLLAADLNNGTARAYQNPVYSGNVPDPSVMQFGNAYYAFATTGKERLSDGRIFTVLRSTNLVNWEFLGGALTPPSDNRDHEYWAPEIAENNGKYYLYYSMGGVEPERFVIRIGIADKPEGPYTDSGKVLMDCQTNRFTIDPFPYRDSDGQWYMYYACNFPFENDGYKAGTGIMVDRLIDMTRLAGECKVVARARNDWTLYESNRVMEVYGKTFDWHTIEGACVFKRDGKYYCLYSGANWQTPRYGLDFVVAEHPMGQFTGQGDHARVLHGIPGKVRGPGHNSVVIGPDGRTQYVVYHAWDKEMTRRELCVDKLEWTADGPRCTPTVTSQPAP